jgi:hypothetical protein|tara:strand:+ start:47 stop:475 length:429 start_codon:yes stop_codon:yes gene_type:complete
MLYVEFLKWVGKQGLKSKVLQKYLNKAWQEGTKGGKVILKTHFPKLLNKAKEYHEGFKRAGLEVVKPIKVPEQTKNILNIKSTLGGRPVKIIRDKKTGKVFEEKVIGPAKVIYGRFPKKLPRKPKADGGSIDKSLPGRSRDI